MLQEILEPNKLGGSGALVLLALSVQLLFLFMKNQKRPTVLAISSIASDVNEKIAGLRYLFSGADLIDRAYRQANGKPFVIHTPERKNVMVTSELHIREVDQAPRDQLSLHAVAKDFLQPYHTMNGFEWKSQRGVEGTGFVRALRSLLTSHLPNVVSSLHSAISDQFSDELRKRAAPQSGIRDCFARLRFDRCRRRDRRSSGSQKIPIFQTAKKLVTRANCVVFFGTDLSNEPKFVEAALHFPEEVFIAAEILRLLPTSIAKVIASCVTRNHRASAIMHARLLETVQDRLAKADLYGTRLEKPRDGIQWLIDTSPKREQWSAERLTGEIMAIWYGSVHTLAIAATYAIVDLYTQRHNIALLRDEVQGPKFDEFLRTSTGLPKMDAFLKESARLSAFESTGVRRQALVPFQFSDGLRIEQGDWVCLPHRTMMRDDRFYPDPLDFDISRWTTQTTPGASSSKLTDASSGWLVWGAGRILCPGRFYASLLLKLIVSHLLLNFDCELQSIRGSRSVIWRSSVIPKSSLTLLVKKQTGSVHHRAEEGLETL